MNFNSPIILASKSPRRQELLREAGYTFEVVSLETDESFPDSIPKKAVAEYIAKQKIKPFRDKYNDTLVITADTTVLIAEEVLGKPSSYNEAMEMIMKLSNEVHSVITGVCLLWKGELKSFSEETLVSFEQVSEEEADFYIKTKKPYDKAGAYGIQEWIGLTKIKWIKGDYYNVVGLPVAKLYDTINNLL
ncbi:MAG: Maf family nucleotide pyrophosphatase [Bacteroidota bacterium]